MSFKGGPVMVFVGWWQLAQFAWNNAFPSGAANAVKFMDNNTITVVNALKAILRNIGIRDSDTEIILKFNVPFKKAWAKLQHKHQKWYTFQKKCFSSLAQLSGHFSQF
jgi:hypothetical protein